jgi:hypothetical protein
MAKSPDRTFLFLPEAPLLATEVRVEYEDLHEVLKQDIKPRGPIEQMYFEDFVHLVWEIFRLRRCKVAVINLNIRSAFVKVVGDLWVFEDEDIEDVAVKWLVDPDVKKQISKILAKYKLDESAIEAEAIRSSFEDLERLVRLLAVQELRRDKAFRLIAEYRFAFAEKLRLSSDRVINGPYSELVYTPAKNKEKSAA